MVPHSSLRKAKRCSGPFDELATRRSYGEFEPNVRTVKPLDGAVHATSASRWPMLSGRGAKAEAVGFGACDASTAPARLGAAMFDPATMERLMASAAVAAMNDLLNIITAVDRTFLCPLERILEEMFSPRGAVSLDAHVSGPGSGISTSHGTVWNTTSVVQLLSPSSVSAAMRK